MAGKGPYAIDLTSEERAELEQRAACYTRPHKEVQRAKMILYAAEGLNNREIAARLDTAPDVVGRWRKRSGEGDRLRAAQSARPAALALLAR